MTVRPRKQVLIKKEFQVRMIFKFILLVLAGSLISGLMLYFLASRDLSSSYFSAHRAIKSTWDLLLPSILISSAVSVVLIAAATAYMILYISHRIAGPLYKVEQLLKRVGDGDLTTECHFREHDELAALGEAFNEMVSNFRERVIRNETGNFKLE